MPTLSIDQILKNGLRPVAVSSCQREGGREAAKKTNYISCQISAKYFFRKMDLKMFSTKILRSILTSEKCFLHEMIYFR